MSEERVIRINKVLRELNISLERAVDYLKDKGIAIDANPNAKISDSEFNILQSQFAGDKGNKEASKEVGEEKRKEKEALRVEREKEVEDKRRQDEERQKQQEIIKAKAVVTGPVQVGK
ncbi:MAG TPA: translation initiation factor IF-2, partial [Chryseobacterium sp.]